MIIPSTVFLRYHLQRSFIAIRITRTNILYLNPNATSCQWIRKFPTQSDADVPLQIQAITLLAIIKAAKVPRNGIHRNEGNETIWFERKSTQDCGIRCWLVDQLSTKPVTKTENRTLFWPNPIRCPPRRDNLLVELKNAIKRCSKGSVREVETSKGCICKFEWVICQQIMTLKGIDVRTAPQTMFHWQ